jgi:Ca2+-binding RTX toxin-like protein
LGSTNSDNSGDYTFTPTTPLDEGEHNIYVSVTGEDGTKVNSDTISFVVDVTAPDTPIVEITTDVNNDGFINADESNGKVDVKITVNNSTEIDDIIVVKDNFGHSYTITVTQEILNNGIIVTFPQPSEGEEIVVTATVQDPAGNISDEGRDSAKIDTSDLSLFGGISVEIVNDVDNNNLIGKDELGSNNTLTVEVTLQKLIVAGDKLIVTGTGNSDKEIILTQADIDKGTVQVDFQAPNNGVTFETTALAIDPAGNMSNLAKDWATMDLTAPDAPTVEITTDINNDGYINAEESNGKIDVKITVPSSTDIGSTIYVQDNYNNGTTITVTQSIINNGVIVSFPEPQEGREIIVTSYIKDLAGNKGKEGQDSAILDTSNLSLGLAVEITTDNNNDGYISKDELQDSNIDVKVTLSPNAAIGDTLTVTGSANTPQIISLTAEHINNGYVYLEFNAPSDGSNFVTTAQLKDIAGNKSNLATDSAIMLLSAPGKPIVTITEDENNDGYINAKELKGDIGVSVALPGTALSGDTLYIDTNSDGISDIGIVLTLQDIQKGSVSFEVEYKGQDFIKVDAWVTDKAGNNSEVGSDEAIIDLIPPQKPTIELYDDEAPYIGVIHSGSTTNDSTPTISGETEANVKVDIYDNGKLIGTTTSDNNGNYTFTPTTKLTDGGHNVYVTATDKAGNSSDSDNIDFAILTTTPQKPEIVDIIDHTGDYSSVTLYGKGEAGLTITLYSVEGSTTSNNQGAFIAVATTIVDANGNWSVDISNLPNTPINDNEFFYAIQTNTAGISSTQSNSVHYYHGDWEIMLTEKEDDFIFTGNDDDVIKVIADDQDDYLVIDGGNGIDKAVFNGKVADFTISKNAKGHTIITSLNPSTDSDLDGTGDIVELRNMEFAEFDDGTYDIEKETFIPTISIIDNNLIEDEAKIIAQAKDIDGIVSLESYIASHGTIELDQNGNIIYTPNADYSGSDHVTITVIDDKGAKATKVVDLWIEPVADKPLLTISVEAQSSFEGNAYTTASQDLGKLALYLNGQNQISAEEIIELQKGPAGNTRLDQYNVELDSFGDGDVAMYGNDRNIHSIDLASSAVITPLETPTVDFAGARLVKNNVFVTRNMKSNKEVFADNTINTDTINGTKGSDALNIGGLTKNSSFYTKDGDDVIVSREGSKIQGSIINTGDGNDTLILNGDISGTTIHTDIAGNTGNDKVFINGSLSNTNIHTFGGHDYVEISGDINTSQVYTGAGNDVIIINTKNITGYNIVDSGTGNDIIIINGHLKDTTIDARDGNDLIALSTFDNVKVDGGMGIDIIYLSKPADRYYFQSATLGYDVNGTGNMTGILVDKDTGGKLYFFNIEGFAFGDGSGLNTNYTTHLISQYTIDIDAALTDRDGSEELSILITGVPSSAVLSSDTYDLKNNNDGTWSLIVPKGEMSVSDSVTMTIIDGHEEFTLGVKAISTEELNGDQSQTALYHDMAAVIIETPKPNHAPIAQAKTSSLLGLIGLDALGLLNLGTNQAYRAYDQDNNIAKVHINYRGVLNLGSINFSYSEVLAKEFGLKIETSYNPGVLGLLIPSSSITITAMDGGAIDNLKIMEFLASVHMGDKFLDVKVLDATTITVTDIYGLSDSATVGSLADINLIDLAKHDSIIEGNEHDNIIVGTDKNDRIYGGDGEDILYGGKGNDILRGGEGNDTLYGEEGDDVLIGGIGADKLYGGVGNDTLYTDFHTDASGNYKGDIVLDGGEGFDTLILEGNNGIDFSQLSYNPIKNMEVLDLREGDHKLENIKLSDVISMTDQNKELIILGDQKDKVSFKNEGSNTWTKVEGTGDNAGFEIYTNSGDPTVTVKVQEYIDDQII